MVVKKIICKKKREERNESIYICMKIRHVHVLEKHSAGGELEDEVEARRVLEGKGEADDARVLHGRQDVALRRDVLHLAFLDNTRFAETTLHCYCIHFFFYISQGNMHKCRGREKEREKRR